MHPADFALPWIHIARTLWANSDSFPRPYVMHKKSRATQITHGADEMHQSRRSPPSELRITGISRHCRNSSSARTNLRRQIFTSTRGCWSGNTCIQGLLWQGRRSCLFERSGEIVAHGGIYPVAFVYRRAGSLAATQLWTVTTCARSAGSVRNSPAAIVPPRPTPAATIAILPVFVSVKSVTMA